MQGNRNATRSRTAIADLLEQRVLLSAWTYQSLIDFNEFPSGADPQALTLDAHGNLFGIADLGGQSGNGLIFEIPHGSNQAITLASLNLFDHGDVGISSFALAVDADGNLFGDVGDTDGVPNANPSLSDGAASLFELPAGAHSVKALSDDEVAGLLIDSAGNVYGTSYSGGSPIFEIPDGSDGPVDISDPIGAQSVGAPVMDARHNLYLSANENDGTQDILKLPVGSSSFVNFITFDNSVTQLGNVLIDGDGNLYGYAVDSAHAFLYEVPYGTQTVVPLAAFADTTTPLSLVCDAAGNLFGTIQDYAGTGSASIFELPHGQHGISDLHTFSAQDNINLSSGLVLDSSGNLFVDSSIDGNVDLNDGQVFELGHGSSELSTIVTFQGDDGANPGGPVAIDRDGDIFEEETPFLGSGNEGSVFEIPPAASTPTPYASFDGLDGDSPDGGLVIGANGNLFGTTQFGGEGGGSTLFMVNAGDQSITSLHAFGFAAIQHGVVQDQNGNLYGVDGSTGEIYEVNEETLSFTIRTTFADTITTGQVSGQPSLTIDSAGDLYVAFNDANSARQMIDEIPAGGTSVTQIASMTRSISDSPIVADSAGDLFGTLGSTIFEIPHGSSEPTTLCTLGGTPSALAIDARGDVAGFEKGGALDNGAIFLLRTGSQTPAVIHSFVDDVNDSPYLTFGVNGLIYGALPEGGAENQGEIFTLTPPVLVDPVLSIAGVSTGYDRNSHGAIGVATGVDGEDLTSLLHLSYQSAADGSVSAAPPTQSGTYSILAEFDGNADCNAIATFDTGQTIVIGPQSLLTSAHKGKLPTFSRKSSTKLKPIAINFNLANTGVKKLDGSVSATFFLSTSPTGTPGDTEISAKTKSIKIAPGHVAHFGSVKIKSVPTGAGTYYVIARLTDAEGATNEMAIARIIIMSP